MTSNPLETGENDRPDLDPYPHARCGGQGCKDCKDGEIWLPIEDEMEKSDREIIIEYATKIAELAEPERGTVEPEAVSFARVELVKVAMRLGKIAKGQAA